MGQKRGYFKIRKWREIARIMAGLTALALVMAGMIKL